MTILVIYISVVSSVFILVGLAVFVKDFQEDGIIYPEISVFD